MNEEKQVWEMAQDMYNALPDDEHNFRDCINAAEELSAKGYRKQSEGAWVKNDHGDNICSCCRLPANYKSRYCPDCGAKLKGD